MEYLRVNLVLVLDKTMITNTPRPSTELVPG